MNVKTRSIPLRIIFIIALVSLVSACGRRSDPKPPEVTAPKPVRFLTAKGDVNAVSLSWQAPEENAHGDPLIDLAGFVIHRAEFDEDKTPRYKKIGEVEIERNAETDAPNYTAKTIFNFRDTNVTPGVRYQYLIAPINDDDVEGEAPQIVRVLFAGESSTIESM